MCQIHKWHRGDRTEIWLGGLTQEAAEEPIIRAKRLRAKVMQELGGSPPSPPGSVTLEHKEDTPRYEKNRMVLCTWKGQPTLEQVIRPPTPISGEEEEVEREDPGIGTRSFPRYSRSKTTLVSFEAFLQNIDRNNIVCARMNPTTPSWSVQCKCRTLSRHGNARCKRRRQRGEWRGWKSYHPEWRYVERFQWNSG